MLRSFESHNFRCFRHLRLGLLDRINIIAGKNNTGKTALLEALYIYSNPADAQIPFAIWGCLCQAVTPATFGRLAVELDGNVIRDWQIQVCDRQSWRPRGQQVGRLAARSEPVGCHGWDSPRSAGH